eukprot:2270024-Amphidinium_carterae.1
MGTASSFFLFASQYSVRFRIDVVCYLLGSHKAKNPNLSSSTALLQNTFAFAAPIRAQLASPAVDVEMAVDLSMLVRILPLACDKPQARCVGLLICHCTKLFAVAA